ncbi:hypothetical protein BJI67_02005 [Acidihalobacter aeolianus]|uniref:Cytochrome b/b6 C-terminal region profile domain-containing protein n=1 Tax=Acidihalobacter aeolianus TaxID=2792603 RepID=A0A1D8K4X4_9GAMM|nr:FAD-dependent oxidoreductase [Acidihalobacter aeolianus]AOV16007.1 hypothetical protein BJI67_02005 [Acidihalobacter aeolianus]
MASEQKRVVVIGNGMAGSRFVKELLKLAPGAYEIIVFGDEPYSAYDRIQLSPLLANERSLSDIMIDDEAWVGDGGNRLYKGHRIVNVDRERRVVTSDKGITEAYDYLVFAVGSKPMVPPIPGRELPEVTVYRTIDDVDYMLERAGKHTHVVVIGGGLLGLEAANALRVQGAEVAVVHIADWLMDRQLDAGASQLLQRRLESKGIVFHIPRMTESIVGEEHVEAVRFQRGEEIRADMVVICAGIVPDTDLAKKIGLKVDRGIVVNDQLETSDPAVFAIGECVQHKGKTYGLVDPCYDQARTLARYMSGDMAAAYGGSQPSTQLKITGIDLYSQGQIMGGEGIDELVYVDARRGVYKKACIKNNRVAGCILYGDVNLSQWFKELIRSGEDISDRRDVLLVGGSSDGEPIDVIGNLPDTAEICTCNSVTKGEIVSAIKMHNLSTVEDIRLTTRAASSCGTCSRQVDQILSMELGSDYAESTPKTLSINIDLFSYFREKDLFFYALLGTIFAAIVFFEPTFFNIFIDQDNSTPANTLKSPADVRPLFFLGPFYAILRSISDKHLGVLMMTLAIVVMFLVPFLDNTPEARVKPHPLFDNTYKVLLLFMLICYIVLGWIGFEPATPVLAYWGRWFTIGYFAFFVAMPVLSLLRRWTAHRFAGGQT